MRNRPHTKQNTHQGGPAIGDMLPAGVGKMIKVHIAWDVTPVPGPPAAAPAGPTAEAAAAAAPPRTPAYEAMASGSRPTGAPRLQPSDRTASAPEASSNDGNRICDPSVLASKSLGSKSVKVQGSNWGAHGPPATPANPQQAGGGSSTAAGSSSYHSSSSSSSLGTSSEGSVELRVSVGVEWIEKEVSYTIAAVRGRVHRETIDKTSASQHALVAVAERWVQQPSERRTLPEVMAQAANA